MEEAVRSRTCEYLRERPLAAAEWRQRVLGGFGKGPALLHKWLRKALWRSQFRHMHYFPPSVSVVPVSADEWRFRPRGGGAGELVSRPLSALENSSNRPVTLIATGPSANGFDWASLENGERQIWAVNGAPGMLAERGLAGDFLVITDHRFARDGIGQIQLAIDRGAVLLCSADAAAVIAATRPELLRRARFHVFEKANDWYALPRLDGEGLLRMNEELGRPFHLTDPPRREVGWSRDPLAGVFSGRTVAFAALQLAVWSGSREIEIVGLDLGGKARAYKEDVPVISHLERDKQDYILPAFACMAAALAGRGTSIINLSPVSALPRDLVPPGPMVP